MLQTLLMRKGTTSQQDPRALRLLVHQGPWSGSWALLCVQAAEFLAGQGFDQVANVVGGIDAYSLRVDPCVPRY